MKFAEIASRLTGISCPIFGISWNAPEAEVAVARRVITFLEDRRVLFASFATEVPGFCIRSAMEIRQYLTSELSKLDTDSRLAGSLRAMRASCRKFLDNLQRFHIGGPDLTHHDLFGDRELIFHSAMGELRGVFGIHIAKLATQYGLDVEDDLATILPEADVDTDTAGL